jgi:hypothetical protein
MKKRMSDEIARVAEIFGLDRNRLIVESISNFIDGEISKCEKRVDKLWFENGMLNKRYGIEDLCKVLDKIETEKRYEEKEIRSISILEAVSDTRRWKHILEDLEKEEARYMKLLELKKKSKVNSYIRRVNGKRDSLERNAQRIWLK